VACHLINNLALKKADRNSKGTQSNNGNHGDEYDESIAETFSMVEDFIKVIVERLSSEADQFKNPENEDFCSRLARTLSISMANIFESEKLLYLFMTLARLCSENKKFLTTYAGIQDFYELCFSCIAKYKETRSVSSVAIWTESLLLKVVKTIRNLIFAKIGIKRKNFIADLLSLLKAFPDNKSLVTDLLRVICKLSENPKIALRITSNGEICQIINSLLVKWNNTNLILALCLHIVNNLIMADAQFGQSLNNSDLFGEFLKIFKEQTSKVR
jgi:hypothetical protein